MSASKTGKETSLETVSFGLAWLGQLMTTAFKGEAKDQLGEEDSNDDGSEYGEDDLKWHSSESKLQGQA